MNPLYNTGIHLYGGAVRLLGSLGHRKAGLMTRGQRSTMEALRRFDAESPEGAERIWIHAASLGEFEQGRPLIEWLRRERPGARILLSFFSPSGYEVRKNFAAADCVVYLPFDTPRAAREFVAMARPSIAVFVKYEFWGNYLTALSRARVPVYIISAIFREGQIFFRPYGGIFRRMLGCFTRIFVQDDKSLTLLRGIGVDPERVTVAGDTRFDRVTDTLRSARQVPEVEEWLDATGGRDRFTLVAGSSWGPDEDVYFPWLASHPEVRAIV
ncbi:MAG: 3-deoxy-D-manno-octulosonic acid transferase, partial [Paramuribaculum sp.]|nr:3-deoxy-D-manno-octulosonic acid transferase [Paramuribaculum sp.]